MAKKSIHLGSKNFFTLVVLSVSALGLMLFTYASQQQTNTQSDASGCRTKPTFTYLGANNGANSVTYSFKTSNPNSASCKPIYYGVIADPEGERNWTYEYKKNNQDWSTNSLYSFATLKSGESNSHKIRVTPPSSAANRTYNLEASACKATGTSGSSGIKVTDKETDCVNINLKYTKD